MIMERQQSSTDLGAYHGRSLGAGPPMALIHALAHAREDAEAYAERRRSSGPPAPVSVDDDDWPDLDDTRP